MSDEEDDDSEPASGGPRRLDNNIYYTKIILSSLYTHAQSTLNQCADYETGIVAMSLEEADCAMLILWE